MKILFERKLRTDRATDYVESLNSGVNWRHFSVCLGKRVCFMEEAVSLSGERSGDEPLNVIHLYMTSEYFEAVL